jgi:hypothetical protein
VLLADSGRGCPEPPRDAVYGQAPFGVGCGRNHTVWIDEVELIDDLSWGSAAVLNDGSLASDGEMASSRAAWHIERGQRTSQGGGLAIVQSRVLRPEAVGPELIGNSIRNDKSLASVYLARGRPSGARQSRDAESGYGPRLGISLNRDFDVPAKQQQDMPQQLHESRKADAEADHFRSIGMAAMPHAA